MAAVDVREQILSRIRAVLGTVAGAQLAARNRIPVSGASRPALVLQDGSEEECETENPGPRGSQKSLMRLSPRVMILAGAPAESIGATLSTLRAALLPAILKDSQLLSLVGGPAGIRGQGQMRYSGCAVELQTGETQEAVMQLDFTFEYVLSLEDLTS